MARSERLNFTPSMVASVALHALVLGAGLIAWPWIGKPKVVQVTPVTLMTSAEMAKLTAAARSETPQEAKVEEPEPAAPVDTPSPQPEPKPPEPPPAPKVAPAPKAPPQPPTPKPPEPKPPTPQPKLAEKTPPKPQPTPKAATRPDPGFDLDALAASIQKNQPGRPSGAAQSSAPKGPTQAQLDIQAREAEGRATAAINDFNSQLASQLQRAWHPNCAAPGLFALRIRVRIELGRDGSLNQAELVDYKAGLDSIKDPAAQAAAGRALAAVAASAPFRNVPTAAAYNSWKSRIVTFVGKDACG